MRLEGLESPWRAAFTLAWDSLRAGSVPVGAVVTDPTGALVAQGNARSMEAVPSPGRLSGTTIAHAEINALAGLPPGRYANHTLWVTLEPCLLCTGAAVIASIGAVRFAAADPLWAGMDRLPELNPFVASRWPRRIGPLDGEPAVLGMLLPLVFYRQRFPDGASVRRHRETAPRVAALVEALVASAEPTSWPALTLDQAIEVLSDRLRACVPA